MNERIEKSLYDILQMIDEIDSFFAAGEKKYANFLNDVRTRRAVERNIEIIGEATNRILKIRTFWDIAKPFFGQRKNLFMFQIGGDGENGVIWIVIS